MANDFLVRAEQDKKPIVSVLKLIKLVYIAHGYYLAMSDKPLISGKVETWKHGPVIPDVYEAFENQIGLNLPLLQVETRLRRFYEGDLADDKTAQTVMGRVWQVYGGFSRQQLSDITHQHSTPWHKTVAKHGLYSVIKNSLIKKYYRDKMKDVAEARRKS